MESLEIDKEMSEDYNDDKDLDVEHYPIPTGLREAWAEVVREDKDKSVK